jgi:hypothetical protein
MSLVLDQICLWSIIVTSKLSGRVLPEASEEREVGLAVGRATENSTAPRPNFEPGLRKTQESRFLTQHRKALCNVVR